MKWKISFLSLSIFNHLLSAHHTWNSRILNKQYRYGVWELRPLCQLEQIEEENFNQSSSLKDRNLETEIMYINSRGETFTNNLRDILFHVINHSTYHRGQITSDFRKNGIEPLVSDYIFYKRI